MKSILVIDDEKDIVEAIAYNLEKENYKAYRSYDGTNGLLTAQSKLPDLIVLDIMLPGISGMEVCKQLKSGEKTRNIPVIMLSAKGEESDKITGLETGADDYMVKPFSIKELIARIKTVLKRSEKAYGEQEKTLRFPDLEIDPVQHTVKAGGKTADLTAKEFSLLYFLAENADRVFSREKLLDTVWGIDVAIETRTVDVHIRKLRDKLKKASRHIKTLHGVGYKFSLKED